MISTTKTNVPGFTAVTTNIRTSKEENINRLVAIWRAHDHIARLAKLTAQGHEGGVSNDGRAGFVRGQRK